MFIIVFQLLLILISHCIKLSPIISPYIYRYIYIYIRIYIYIEYIYILCIFYVYYIYMYILYVSYICILYVYHIWILYMYIVYVYIIYIYSVYIYINPMISDDLPLTTILWAGTVRHPRWCLRLRIPWNFGQFLEVPWALFCFAWVRVGFQKRGILAWKIYIYSSYIYIIIEG